MSKDPSKESVVKRRFLRIRWFRIHSLGGLSFALLLIFVLFTVTIATISIDLDWLSKPALRASKTKGSGSFPWATCYYNAQDTYSDVEVTSICTPKAPWFTAEGVAVNRGDLPLAGAYKGKRFRIYFHPWGSAGDWVLVYLADFFQENPSLSDDPRKVGGHHCRTFIFSPTPLVDQWDQNLS